MTIALLDIEGTVCPITFVKDVLFPYFLLKFPAYLQDLEFPLQPQNDLAKILTGFPEQATLDAETLKLHIESLVAKDIKDPTLKAFQGVVWKLGYTNGDLKAPLYPDAIDYINRAKKIYIYSSGSVPAQILLFKHVEVSGKLVDFTPKLSGYFDITTSGHKQESSSYTKILKDIGCGPSEVVFYSDNVKEVEAAIESGMRSKVVIRPGNAPIGEVQYDCITTFAEEN